MTIHRSLFHNVSDALDRMMNGPLAEAQHGRAYLPDVHHDVFVAVCEFAYTGDIKDSLYYEKSKSKHEEPKSAAARSITLDETPSCLDALFFYNFTNPYTDILRPLKVSEGSVSEASIEFLAKLAILAQRYLMPGLVQMSLNYLRGFLLTYRFETTKPTFLIHLMELAHNNGGETVGNASQSLKQKIHQYTACQWSMVKQSDEFMGFLGANPDISIELMQIFTGANFPNAEEGLRICGESEARYIWIQFVGSKFMN